MFKYFWGSTIATLIGLPLCGFIGWYYEPTTAAALQALFIGFVLAVLEISLSFDNAVVNAVVLNKMNDVWRHRFITWGMLIAVFGMRLVFPLAIVSIIGRISPWAALEMAAFDPKHYGEIMLSAHMDVAAFGGTFLLMVGLKFFFDRNKEVHWIQWFERPLVNLGKLNAIEMTISILVLITLSYFVPQDKNHEFLLAGLFGLVTYAVVDSISAVLEHFGNVDGKDVAKASAGLFIYLEVLDASFSFDGVIGAFAITSNLFIIMIGLSIGAFFVRSLTIMFVERKTVQEFKYLEHGAFYAILSLAFMMLGDPLFHIPEWVTGLTGAIILALAMWASLRVARNEHRAATRAK